jgi:hypothetical protein
VEQPDFYLGSSEGYGLETPRRCYRLRRIAGRSGDDYLLVRIDPPIIGQEYGLGDKNIHRVILATKHEGASLFPISSWPAFVHVARMVREPREGDTLTREDLELIGWGELEPRTRRGEQVLTARDRRTSSATVTRHDGSDVESAAGVASMRFSEIAERVFSFLEGAGFKLVQREPGSLRYETTSSMVSVEWDARSGEMNVFFGLQPIAGQHVDAFSLSDLLDMLGIDASERTAPFQVADEKRLAPFLEKMANDTRVHAQPALSGDRMFFRRLQTFRESQSQKYMRSMRLRQVRAKADEAWRDRQLESVVALYGSIEDDLSESEKVRLAYARKHGVQ